VILAHQQVGTKSFGFGSMTDFETVLVEFLLVSWKKGIGYTEPPKRSLTRRTRCPSTVCFNSRPALAAFCVFSRRCLRHLCILFRRPIRYSTSWHQKCSPRHLTSARPSSKRTSSCWCCAGAVWSIEGRQRWLIRLAAGFSGPIRLLTFVAQYLNLFQRFSFQSVGHKTQRTLWSLLPLPWRIRFPRRTQPNARCVTTLL
jgi:hypothetical protein